MIGTKFIKQALIIITKYFGKFLNNLCKISNNIKLFKLASFYKCETGLKNY